ncbi:hypothetical protein [Mariniflexile maritimum]|uniref:hypothetical protein n=1 Tax=Mariniflexile maritimum TaxID=2682493 RepID=UPI0012F64EEC|nr:hypothetical protein [Mariniflexile maritimum]
MYDRFGTNQILEKQNFSFNPSRYEIWIGGKEVKNGNTNKLISANVIKVSGIEKMEINIKDSKLENEISEFNIFDQFITSGDRLILLIIPKITNVENVAFGVFRNTIGSTRNEKNFKKNEPFACSLFLINGIISKMSFSFSNPEKQIIFQL